MYMSAQCSVREGLYRNPHLRSCRCQWTQTSLHFPAITTIRLPVTICQVILTQCNHPTREASQHANPLSQTRSAASPPPRLAIPSLNPQTPHNGAKIRQNRRGRRGRRTLDQIEQDGDAQDPRHRGLWEYLRDFTNVRSGSNGVRHLRHGTWTEAYQDYLAETLPRNSSSLRDFLHL